MAIDVIIATYGTREWRDRALTTAECTAAVHSVYPITTHGRTLAEARNDGARRAEADWLCFLDADDHLEPGYIRAMSRLVRSMPAERAPLLAPRVRYSSDRGIRSFANRNIDRINPCVIGTLVKRSRFFEAGGFWEEQAWEDWSLFRRCWLLGSRVTHVASAIYGAHGTPGGSGRNLSVRNPELLHDSIIKSHNDWKAKGCPPLCS